MKEIIHTFNIDYVFSLALNGITRVNVGEYNVSIRRMQCYANKGVECVACRKVKGTELVLEKWKDNGLHVDLYGVTEEGKRVLLTIDHIIPRSKGGKDVLENYQPMCEPCNSKKGDKYDR